MPVKVTARTPRMDALVRLFARGEGVKSISKQVATDLLRKARAAVRSEGGIYGVPQWKKTAASTEYARGIRGGGRLKEWAKAVKSRYTDTTATIYIEPPLTFHAEKQDRKIWNKGNQPLWFPYPNGNVRFKDGVSFFRGYAVKHIQPARPSLPDEQEVKMTARETVDRAIRDAK